MLWLPVTLVLFKKKKKGTCRAQQGRAWCKQLKSPLCALCASMKSACGDGRGKKWHHPTLFPGEWSSHLPLFGKPNRRVNNFSCCVQDSVRSLPSPCLCLSHLPTWQHRAPVLLCFTSEVRLGSKRLNFRDPAQCRPMLILLGRDLPSCGCCRLVPEWQSHECAGAWNL